MKHPKYQKQAYLLLALLFSLLLSACGKSKSNVTNPLGQLTTQNTQFYWNGLACLDRNTNSQVSTSLCTSTQNNQTANTGYYVLNGFCYAPNGQVVNTSFCSAATNTGNQCYGYYLTQQSQYVQCNGANCAGYTLYSTTTGQYVQCM